MVGYLVKMKLRIFNVKFCLAQNIDVCFPDLTSKGQYKALHSTKLGVPLYIEELEYRA